MSKIQGVIKTVDPSKQRYKVASKEDRIIEGYFTTADVDRIGDISLPSAFVKTFESYMKNPVLTFMHDIRQVIGKVLDYNIDENGVWIRAQVAKGIQYIDDVWSLIEQGMIKGFSYGYSVKDEDKEIRDGVQVNVLKEVDIYEIAVVTVPMNGNAQFSLAGASLKGISLNLGELVIPETKAEKIEQKQEVSEEIQEQIGEIIVDMKELAKEFLGALKEDKDFLRSLLIEAQNSIREEEELLLAEQKAAEEAAMAEKAAQELAEKEAKDTKEAEEKAANAADDQELINTILEMKSVLSNMAKLFNSKEEK